MNCENCGLFMNGILSSRVVDFSDSIELDNMEGLLVKLNRGVKLII